jgi:hypothetical protein
MNSNRQRYISISSRKLQILGHCPNRLSFYRVRYSIPRAPARCGGARDTSERRSPVARDRAVERGSQPASQPESRMENQPTTREGSARPAADTSGWRTLSLAPPPRSPRDFPSCHALGRRSSRSSRVTSRAIRCLGRSTTTLSLPSFLSRFSVIVISVSFTSFLYHFQSAFYRLALYSHVFL